MCVCSEVRETETDSMCVCERRVCKSVCERVCESMCERVCKSVSVRVCESMCERERG